MPQMSPLNWLFLFLLFSLTFLLINMINYYYNKTLTNIKYNKSKILTNWKW